MEKSWVQGINLPNLLLLQGPDERFRSRVMIFNFPLILLRTRLRFLVPD